MRKNGFLVTAKIFVPHDAEDLDGFADRIAAIKAADGKDLAGVLAIGTVVDTKRKYTSHDMGEPAPAADPAPSNDAEPAPQNDAEPDPAPAESTGRRGRAAA